MNLRRISWRRDANNRLRRAQAVLRMKIMFDTNICIYLIKKQPPSIVERFTAFQIGDIGISVVTLAELNYGVSKSRHQSPNRTALQQFISPLEVTDFGREAATVMDVSGLRWKSGARLLAEWIF